LKDWNNSICSHLNRYQFIYFCIPDSNQRSMKDHQQILDFVSMGDYEKAKKSLITHLRYTLEFLLNEISGSKVEEV
jgi:DNA-binding GntR family transcriptional regulator